MSFYNKISEPTLFLKGIIWQQCCLSLEYPSSIHGTWHLSEGPMALIWQGRVADKEAAAEGAHMEHPF